MLAPAARAGQNGRVKTTLGPHRPGLLAVTLALTLAGAAAAAGASAASEPFRDTYPDTWSATDALGRQLPGSAETGPPRADRFVGLFYFLWLGPHAQGGPYDITKLKAENPTAPHWGPFLAPHHWGESIFGYYLTEDPYVLAHHAQMLADAGVDTLIFDVTNQVTYRENYLALLRAFREARARGWRTPQVMFLTPFWDPGKVVAELYRELYQPNLYPEFWFRWEGKPLILADPARLGTTNAALRDFFTFRRPQPDYFQGPTQPGMWSWLEVHPQHGFTNAQGVVEEMSVGVAQNAVRGRLGSMSEPGVCGRSFHDGHPGTNAADLASGPNFAEQAARALKVDPRFVFLTGWNEWIAGRFPEFNGVKGEALFPDEFDQDGSRDIEPMKGGHGDNYYYQMAAWIRRYKGTRPPPPASPPRTIQLAGAFDQWSDVAPEYRDDLGDTIHRDFDGYNHSTHYTNNSGRNDFTVLKVTRDAEQVYFYARTREPITPPTDDRWMMLLIDADQNHATGWEGYDFIINRTRRDATTAVLERNTGAWHWAPVGEVKFVVRGNELHLAIPRAALGPAFTSGKLHFDFKWADNVPESGDILDFTTHGDVAPNGRFNYRFEEPR